MMETHRFRNDTQTRKRLMVPESFQHPAKGQLGMWALMIDRYSQPGDTVLDPMAGSGATLLAALMGRNVICVELEPHFVEPMRRSWEKMRQHPMLGHEMGQAAILRGDARCLPLPDASVGAAITSPPFLGNHDGLAGDEKEVWRMAAGKLPSIGSLKTPGYTRPVDAIVTSPPYEGSLHEGQAGPNATSDHRAWAENREVTSAAYTRSVDAIVTSPPYEGQLSQGSDGIDWTRMARDGDVSQQPHLAATTRYRGYTRPVDAIVTSPPYEGVADASKNTNTNDAARGHPETQGRPMTYGRGENIGNLRGTQYWESMKICYAECWRVLRPGGILALVLKGFTRDGVYQDLPGQTEAMLLEAGWVKHEHWRRELWSLSFWRILQKRRDPAAWDNRLMYEEVLAFRKPGGEGNGVDAVLTSPPYETSIKDDPEHNSIDYTKNKRDGDTSHWASHMKGASGNPAMSYTRKERT